MHFLHICALHCMCALEQHIARLECASLSTAYHFSSSTCLLFIYCIHTVHYPFLIIIMISILWTNRFRSTKKKKKHAVADRIDKRSTNHDFRCIVCFDDDDDGQHQHGLHRCYLLVYCSVSSRAQVPTWNTILEPNKRQKQTLWVSRVENIISNPFDRFKKLICLYGMWTEICMHFLCFQLINWWIMHYHSLKISNCNWLLSKLKRETIPWLYFLPGEYGASRIQIIKPYVGLYCSYM